MKLSVNYNDFVKEAEKLFKILNNLQPVSPKYRKLIAEIILLRFFALFEEQFFSIASKVICETPYCDGTRPTLLQSARSKIDAHTKMLHFGRGKKILRFLNWSKATFINDNVQNLIDPRDHFVQFIKGNGTIIDDMRRIRNRIAHKNPKARQGYQYVVQKYYGAPINRLTPGDLLLSPRFTPILLEQYLLKGKILIKNLVKK